MELSIMQWIFQGIPECLALAALAIVLAGKILDLRTVLLIGIPYAITTYLVRLLHLSFGIHFIIFIVALAILLSIWLKTSFSRSLLTALSGLIILAIAETVFVAIAYEIIGIPFEEVRQDLILWITYGWPHIIFLLFLTFIIESQRKRRRIGRVKSDA